MLNKDRHDCWERKVVESSNLVNLVFKSVKIFYREPSKNFFDLNALLIRYDKALYNGI